MASALVEKKSTVGLPILRLAEVGTTVSADHLLQMATMPLEQTNGLGNSLPAPGLLSFRRSRRITPQLALFGLLATANTPRYCPQATGFGQLWQCPKHAPLGCCELFFIADPHPSMTKYSKNVAKVKSQFGVR